MSDFPSLMPLNVCGIERDFEQVQLRLRGMAIPIRALWNPEICPEHLLPYLAWAMSIDIWDDTWTLEQKRAAITSSVAVHRVKGTKGAVKRALDALGLRLDLTEWFESGEAVHTFRIDAFGSNVFGAGFEVDAELFATVTRVIENVKPVRSHFILRIGIQHNVDISVRTGSRRRAAWNRTADPVVPTLVNNTVFSLRCGRKELMIEDGTHNFIPHEEVA